jgi:hypothetical protein
MAFCNSCGAALSEGTKFQITSVSKKLTQSN